MPIRTSESMKEEEPFVSFPADISLPEPVYQLNQMFREAGHSLFVVGGAVRDYLFHRFQEPQIEYRPKDVDLATEALPSKVLALLRRPDARRAGFSSYPKGEAFGVISARVRGQDFEIATFREEWYDPELGDGRRPDQVRFSTPGRDARRRDLTINALFYDIQNSEIRDYNFDQDGKGQGIEDLRNKVIRPVGNPQERFREDRLRISRLVRFFSRYNPGDITTQVGPETLAAVAQYRHLPGVSPERIAAEFLSGLNQALVPVTFLKNYAALDLFPAVFPGLVVETRDLDRIDRVRNPKAIMAWLLRSNPDPRKVKTQLRSGKFSGEIFERVEFLLNLNRFEPGQVLKYLRHRDLYRQEKVQEFQVRKKENLFEDVRAFAQIAGRKEEWEHFLNYQPVARAQDFKHLQGSAITEALREAEARAYQESFRKQGGDLAAR